MIHTGVVGLKIKFDQTWAWRAIPIGAVLAARILDQIKGGMEWGAVVVDLSLLTGWIIGWMLAEADHLMYATMCNPQEMTCQRVRSEIDKKDWRRAWGLLQETRGERTKLPIRNVLTGFVMTGLGLWIVTSSGSLLAAGVVFGFGVRLFSEILTDPDYQKWYWIFARNFEPSEHRGILIAWAAGLAWQWLVLLRG